MKSTTPVIEFAEADVSHFDVPETVLIHNINWRICYGEFWVVGGRPASGKTSLLLTAAGLNRPAGGSLKIFGKDLAEAKEKDQIGWRHRIGFVFEYGGRVFNHLTVAENLELPVRYHVDAPDEEIRSTVDELLAKTDLQAYAQHLPSRLSLAVQQRVALARALTATAGLTAPPEILFLDNPLSTLSLRDCRWWLDFLRQLQESRSGGAAMTIIASADDFRGWTDVASHFAVVDNNRFTVIGEREQLKGSAEPIVRELLATET